MNSPTIDNTEKKKAKKQKEKLEVELGKILEFTIDGERMTGADLVARADALAAAKIASKALDKTIKEGEEILKAFMYQHWCHEVALNGRAPDMRQIVGAMSRFDVSQYTKADVTDSKTKSLKEIGVDVAAYSKSTKHTVRMGNVPTPMVSSLLDAMKGALGDELYDKVVSVSHKVEDDFFENMRNIVQDSLSGVEKLTPKMELVMSTVKPTIQFLRFDTDLQPPEAFDFAYQYACIDNPDRKAK
jgi:hypothetical protein